MIAEDNFWEQSNINNIWIYDKLILSKKLGYTCGPIGINVPKPNFYIVRPVTNILGMGQNTHVYFIEKSTNHLPIGTFWCEIFKGRHLSVDYVDGKQVLCVEGIRDNSKPFYKWKLWKKVDDKIPYPSIIPNLNHLNIELIGNKIIEVHARLNPNFKFGGNTIYPVWKGEDITPPEGMKYVKAPEYKRIGFFISDK